MGRRRILGAPQVVGDPETVIRVHGAEKSYGGQHALAGVDLEVERGQIYGLLGPDGAGKSTLMKILSGVLRHDRGDVEVFGTVIDSERSAELVKDRIGFMPQGLGQNLYRELSVEENVDFFARLRLVSEDQLAQRKQRLYAMTRLGEFRDRPMKQLSGGMKQKLGLVCTLIHEPELVVLDEPTTGVDPVSRRDFWSIVAELLHERGITALVSTAYMDEAARFHRAALLFSGRVLAEGEPDDIRAEAPGAVVSLSCESTGEVREALRDVGRTTSLGDETQVFVASASLDEARSAVEKAVETSDLSVGKVEAHDPGLEDVFLTLLERESSDPSGRPSDTPLGYQDVSSTDRSETDGAAVRADGLTKRFGDFTAVDDVSFEVGQGEVFGLLGANGAGKTTAIKMLLGILKPTAGSSYVAGSVMRQATRRLRELIGYVSQQFTLYEDLTVTENIRLYAGVYGLSRRDARERTDWVLEMSSLRAHRGSRAASLPVGLKQRLALGCSLVHRPQVLFLDEPTSGVDPLGRRAFWEILNRLSREAAVAILVTTHYMSEAERCDRLALMFGGSIIAAGSPAEMKRAVEDEAGVLLEVRCDRPLEALDPLQEADYEGVGLFGEDIHLLASDDDNEPDRIRRLLADRDIDVESIERRSLSMEDVFVYRTLGMERGRNRAA
jgi:ABC-2 type transport system ATP-binding protein